MANKKVNDEGVIEDNGEDTGEDTETAPEEPGEVTAVAEGPDKDTRSKEEKERDAAEAQAIYDQRAPSDK